MKKPMRTRAIDNFGKARFSQFCVVPARLTWTWGKHPIQRGDVAELRRIFCSLDSFQHVYLPLTREPRQIGARPYPAGG